MLMFLTHLFKINNKRVSEEVFECQISILGKVLGARSMKIFEPSSSSNAGRFNGVKFVPCTCKLEPRRLIGMSRQGSRSDQVAPSP